MTNAEADNLIATIPKPRGLRLYREGTWIRMTGGKTGAHSIAVGPSSGQRLLIHWQGYVRNQGLTVEPVAPALSNVSPLARNAYRVLCSAKNHTLVRETLTKKLGVGRWKAYSHTALFNALAELAKTGLVTSDAHGRYTAVCDEKATS